MPKITKRIVDAAAADPARRFYVWDTDIKGFGLQVLPSGGKSYVYQYRTPEGRTRRATIGKHGEFTPDQARVTAEKMRSDIRDGRDPLDDKRERRDAKTVNDVLDAYLDGEAFAAKADKTRATDRGRINRHIRPLLGRDYVSKLTPEKIKRASAAIAAGKTALTEKTGVRGLARVRGGIGAARKSVRLLHTALAWAVSEGLVAGNPAEGVKTGSDGTRDVILEDAEAYARLFRSLDTMEYERRIRPAAADAIRVIALTGARRGEIIGLRWGDVDLKAGLLTLLSHKTAGSTGKPRIIGLPAVAQAIIARQPPGEAQAYVFAPARGSGQISINKPWTDVRVAAELPKELGLHGLRHSLATHMALAGAQASAIMTALGHANMATSQRYVHVAQAARQMIAEKAAGTALAGMAGASPVRVVR